MIEDANGAYTANCPPEIENAVWALLRALEEERAKSRRSPLGVLRQELGAAVNRGLNALYLNGRIAVEPTVNDKLITTIDANSHERGLAEEV